MKADVTQVDLAVSWGGQLHPSCALLRFGWDQQLCGSSSAVAATH